MDEANNYAVISLENLFALRDELTLLRKEVGDKAQQLREKDVNIRNLGEQILRLQENLAVLDAATEEHGGGQ